MKLWLCLGDGLFNLSALFWMKRLIQIALVFTAARMCVTAIPAPIDDVKAAVEQLDAAPNYSWKAVTSSKVASSISRRSPIEGQTEREGYTYFRFVLEGNAVEAAFRGTKAAIRTEAEWESHRELRGDREWVARRLMAFKVPASEVVHLLAISGELKKGWRDVYSGNLTSNGVRALLGELSRDSMIASVAPGAFGTVRFWVKKGALVKYEFQVRGTVVLQDQGQQFAIDRTTTVEIENVGSTRVMVPEGARKKLGE